MPTGVRIPPRAQMKKRRPWFVLFHLCCNYIYTSREPILKRIFDARARRNSPHTQCAEKVKELPKGVYDNLEYNTMEYYHTSINMTKAIYSKDHKYIVEQLKKARQGSGLDQQKVAKLLGKTQSHVSKVEAGQRRIDIVTLKEFARIYKKPMDYFLK